MDMGVRTCHREIVNKNREEKWAKSRALGNTLVHNSVIRLGTLYGDVLTAVTKICIEPEKSISGKSNGLLFVQKEIVVY